MNVYKVNYSDPRWNESQYVSASDNETTRRHCEALMQDYAKALKKDKSDIKMMGWKLPLHFRWDGDSYEVTDSTNVAVSGDWNHIIAYVSYEKLEVINLDAEIPDNS